jgi:hypothetical protein
MLAITSGSYLDVCCERNRAIESTEISVASARPGRFRFTSGLTYAKAMAYLAIAAAFIVVCCPMRAASGLSNGTEIKSRLWLDGCGELNIKNGTPYDAIVNLVDHRTRRLVRSFYVQSDKNFVEKNIAPGIYEIYFSTGKDWDSRSLSFNYDASYARLERQIEYTERADPLTGQIAYRGYNVTLEATEGGEVTSFPVDKQTFQAMMMDQPTNSAQVEKAPVISNPTAAD